MFSRPKTKLKLLEYSQIYALCKYTSISKKIINEYTRVSKKYFPIEK